MKNISSLFTDENCKKKKLILVIFNENSDRIKKD
jgi:hypothetical protein